MSAHPIDHGPRDRPRVALTFDDGPGDATGAVLDALRRHRAAATFDLLGSRVAGHEALVRRIDAEGHEIGSHGFDHERLAGRPLAALVGIRRANRALRRAGAARPRVFRAPYGSVSAGVVRAARLAGLTTVGWDVDPRDFEEPGAEAIAERVIAAVRPGSIVLLHDDRPELVATARALELVLPVLRERALEPVTVSALLDG